jgi:uncharacterized membrane protein YqjE
MPDSETGSPTRGLLHSLRRVLAGVIEIVQTRIELVITELEEQRLRTGQIAATEFFALFFLAMAIILGTLTVVMLFWQTNPMAVLAGFTALYLALAIIAAVVLRTRLKARPRLLSATLAELLRDRDHLKPPS